MFVICQKSVMFPQEMLHSLAKLLHCPNLVLAFKTIASHMKISMRLQNFSIVKKVLLFFKIIAFACKTLALPT